MKTMTENELGTTLAEMYNTALKNEKVVHIYLFGIKYGDVILSNQYHHCPLKTI